MRLRFRLRTILILTFAIAVLLAFILNFVAQKRREATAIAELARHLLFTGARNEGPSWLPKQYKNHWYFLRYTHLELRLESTDVDRTRILERLRDFPSLETIELVEGDPFPQTYANLLEMAKEIEATLPGVRVSLPP